MMNQVTDAKTADSTYKSLYRISGVAALIAGVFAGIALVMFQLTYVKFIFKSSMRIRGKPLDNDNNEILP